MSEKTVNPFETKKDSLTELALMITKRNIEKKAEKQNKLDSKQSKKSKKKKKKKNKENTRTNFNIVKMSDGSIVHFIPGNMHEKGFKRKLAQNIEDINKFIDSQEKTLNI